MSILIAALCTFLAGFFIGRRIGIKEGYREGANYAPIALLEKSLEEGRCAICQREAFMIPQGQELLPKGVCENEE